MANSRLGMETKSLTEGALMAALTAILAMAGMFIPILEPVVMMIWTLPVVVVCLRWGMRPGAVTMAAAGLVILIITTPTYAVDMLLRSAGPALLIGYGFRRRWKSEATIFFTALAAFAGLAASYALTFALMGIGLDDMFSVAPETIDEFVRMLTEYGVMEWVQMPAAEFAEYVASFFSTMKYLFPAILLVAGLITAFTNFVAANFVLGKLKVPLPPVTKPSDFRMPFPFIFGFILGMGLTVVGGVFWPGTPLIAQAGQNVMIVFVALYFFQGMGLIFHFIGRAEPSARKFLKVMLIIVILMTFFYFFTVVGLVGVADALFDFRRMGLFNRKK